MKLPWISLCCIAACIATFGQAAKSTRPTSHSRVAGGNVLLITIDTLRADHVGAYGSSAARTSTLDHLAQDGVLFERAYSQVPLTLASHTSLLTGTYPFHNGVQDFTGQPLGPDIRTIAQALKAKGYDTGAVVSSYVLDRSWGLDRGFAFYYDVFKGDSFLKDDPALVERKAGPSVDQALSWLKRPRKTPFFFWLHLYDPHSGYEPPEPFRTRFPKSPYDGEIAYADSQLGRVIAYLKAHALYDRTLIIFASDHGESLGEHGEKEHGFFVYQSTLHVPLIIKPFPSDRVPSRRVSKPVPIMGIAPTILALLKLHDPIESQFETANLLADESDSHAEVYSESFYSFSSFGWSPLRTVSNDTYQYIEAPNPELYNLRDDPAESRNLLAKQPAVASVLENKLKDLVSRYAPGESTTSTAGLSAEAAEKLRSLGYMAYRSPVSPEALAKGLADPKDKIEDFNTLLNAVDAGKLGEADKEKALLKQVQANNPDMYLIPFLLGEAALSISDWTGAEQALRRSLQLNPNFDQSMTALARSLHEQDKNDEARQWVEKALAVNPQNLKAWYQRGWMSMANDPDAASADFEKALSIQPSFAMAHRDLGMILLHKGEYADAAKHLQQAASLGLNRPQLFNFLGIAYSRTGRYQDAAEVYEKALEKDPQYAEAHLNLSYVYEKLSRPREAHSEYEIACKLKSELCQYQPEKAQ